MKVHKSRIYLIILTLLSIITVFLPWSKSNDGSNIIGLYENGNWQWIILIILFLILIFATLGKLNEPLNGLIKYSALLLSMFILFFGIYKVYNLIGIGIILLQICSIVILFILFNKKN